MDFYKIIRKILQIVQGLSHISFLLAFIYLIALNTDLFAEDIVMDESSMKNDIKVDENFLTPFSLFEYSIKKSSREEFILKSFKNLGFETFKLETKFGNVLHSILRPRQSDRKEGIALVFKYDPDGMDCFNKNVPLRRKKVVSGAAMILNIAKNLKNLKPIAKSVVFVAVPRSDSVTEKKLLDAWTIEYFSSAKMADFPRAGKIVAALHVDVSCQFTSNKYTVISGSKLGTLPNMDILALTFNFLNRNDIAISYFDHQTLQSISLGSFFADNEALMNFADRFRSFLPWQLRDAFSSASKMLRFVVYQASCSDKLIENDSPFLERGIDSLTLKSVSGGGNNLVVSGQKVYSTDIMKYILFFIKTFSNTNEKLHHSLTIYTILAPFKIVRFLNFSFVFVFFLFPSGVYSLNTYLDHKTNLTHRLPEFALVAVLYLSSLFVWICPSALSSFDISAQTLVPVTCALCGSVLLFSIHFAFKSLDSIHLDFVVMLLNLIFSLLLLPLMLVNLSLSFVYCAVVSPLIFALFTKSAVLRGLVFAVESAFLLLFAAVIFSVFGGIPSFVLEAASGYFHVEGFRNLNYFGVLVVFGPVGAIFGCKVLKMFSRSK